MKYIKYTLLVLFILIIGFFLIGIIKSEITYDCEIIIDKPLGESWAVSQDEEKMKDWLDGFQKIEHVSGTPGAIGAVSDVYFLNDGEEMIIRETITDIVLNESISMVFETDFMDMDYTLSMSAIEGKTKITSNTTALGNNMISKSFVALFGSFFKTQEDTNLTNLKKTIENNTKSY